MHKIIGHPTDGNVDCYLRWETPEMWTLCGRMFMLVLARDRLYEVQWHKRRVRTSLRQLEKAAIWV